MTSAHPLSALTNCCRPPFRLRNKGPGVPLRTVSDDPFEYDVQRRVPSTEKAKRLLDFEATTTLDEMLAEVIPWIEQAIQDGTI